MTLEQTMKYLLVSNVLPGPTIVVARNMRVTGKRVFDQNCIVAFRREPTVSFITEIDRGEELSALKAQPLFKREIPGRHDSDTVP